MSVYALCNVAEAFKPLQVISASTQLATSGSTGPDGDQSALRAMLDMIPGLQQYLVGGFDPSELQSKLKEGFESARSEDSKTIKKAIPTWLVPDGSPIPSDLAEKMTRGFRNDVTGALLCPVCKDWSDAATRAALRDAEGYNDIRSQELRKGWPTFIYAEREYDPAMPWKGLFRGSLLLKGFRHVFFGPSAVFLDKGNRSRRSGNAALNGMKKVTPASIAYIAAQVKFCLSSERTRLGKGASGDFKQFYTLAWNLLTDVAEKENVDDLLVWWNREMMFHGEPVPFEGSPLSQIRKHHAKRNAEQDMTAGPSES
ncbi:hypothetical protein DXG01_009362 [Tephrocybe rancida]|nr:hypothetical protein DXG01_009362 [Tephrocybe rancida]